MAHGPLVFEGQSLKPPAQFQQISQGPSVERVLTIFSNGCPSLNKMAAMTIYGKITLKSSPAEPKTSMAETWYIALRTQGLPSLFMMILDWPLTFLQQGQICIPIHL